MATLEIRNVSKFYRFDKKQSLHALEGVELKVAEGEFVALIGPSGCGKSTLLHLVAALDEVSGGSILIDGEAPSMLRAKHQLGIAFQEHALLPWLSVSANLALPYKIAHRKPDDERIRALTHLVGLDGFEQARPRQLSGGMRQRASIARSLALDPKLLLLDEPFGALDAVNRRHLNVELQRIWQEKQITTVMVTHSVEEAIFLGDRVAVMNGRPGSIAKILDVPFARPRDAACTRSEAFHQLADQLTALLEPSPGRAK